MDWGLGLDWIGLAAVPFLLRHARVTASTGMMEIESLASTASDNQDCTSKEKTHRERERQKGKAKGERMGSAKLRLHSTRISSWANSMGRRGSRCGPAAAGS
jgi:hypothetical protein